MIQSHAPFELPIKAALLRKRWLKMARNFLHTGSCCMVLPSWAVIRSSANGGGLGRGSKDRMFPQCSIQWLEGAICSWKLLQLYCRGGQVAVSRLHCFLGRHCKVLQKFNTHRGPTTVYVTDYTANPLAYPLTPNWCQPGLFGHILQCEMWDGAKVAAKGMTPGEYWYLDNIWAKWNPAYYTEGTMHLQQKTTHLDETSSQDWRHLRDFLACVF